MLFDDEEEAMDGEQYGDIDELFEGTTGKYGKNALP